MTKYNEAQVDFRERSKGRIQRQLEISMCLKMGQCLSLPLPARWLSIPSPGRSNNDRAAWAFCILFGVQIQDRWSGIGMSIKWYPRLKSVLFGEPRNFILMGSNTYQYLLGTPTK